MKSCCFRPLIQTSSHPAAEETAHPGSSFLRKRGISYMPPRRVPLMCSMVRITARVHAEWISVFDLVRASGRVCLPETNQAAWKGCVCTFQIAGYTVNNVCSPRGRGGTYPKACACLTYSPNSHVHKCFLCVAPMKNVAGADPSV